MMDESPKISPPASTERKSPPPPPATRLQPLIITLVVVVAAFALPLVELGKLSSGNDLYSHILLIPLVSLYLVWNQRSVLSKDITPPNRKIAGALTVVGLLVAALSWGNASGSVGVDPVNYLAPKIIALVLLVSAACAWFTGRQTLRAIAFPLFFLIFMVPFPTFMLHGLETFLQHGSAAVAYALFKLSGTTVFYENLIFRLPGINLEVAPECSGIRSSLALFITSVLAGHFFLRSPWKIAILSLAVIPLALLRNGFRIFTLGELCVRISSDMIDSYIHHKGGPIFFALSLIPFFFLLRFLYKSEQRNPDKRPAAS